VSTFSSWQKLEIFVDSCIWICGIDTGSLDANPLAQSPGQVKVDRVGQMKIMKEFVWINRFSGTLIIAGSVVVFRSPCKLQLKPFYFQSGHTAYILTNWYLIIAGSISIDNYFSIFLYSLIIPTPLTPSPPKKNIPRGSKNNYRSSYYQWFIGHCIPSCGVISIILQIIQWYITYIYLY
jgi:hypothetical protein